MTKTDIKEGDKVFFYDSPDDIFTVKEIHPYKERFFLDLIDSNGEEFNAPLNQLTKKE